MRILAILLLLVACSEEPKVSPNLKQYNVEINFVDNRLELIDYCGVYHNLNGCARWRGSECKVYVLKRNPLFTGCVLQHEIKHCIDGDWHPEGADPSCG